MRPALFIFLLLIGSNVMAAKTPLFVGAWRNENDVWIVRPNGTAYSTSYGGEECKWKAVNKTGYEFLIQRPNGAITQVRINKDKKNLSGFFPPDARWQMVRDSYPPPEVGTEIAKRDAAQLASEREQQQRAEEEARRLAQREREQRREPERIRATGLEPGDDPRCFPLVGSWKDSKGKIVTFTKTHRIFENGNKTEIKQRDYSGPCSTDPDSLANYKLSKITVVVIYMGNNKSQIRLAFTFSEENPDTAGYLENVRVRDPFDASKWTPWATIESDDWKRVK